MKARFSTVNLNDENKWKRIYLGKLWYFLLLLTYIMLLLHCSCTATLSLSLNVDVVSTVKDSVSA